MEITITWTKIIVLICLYFAGRYVYFSYMKYVTGCQNPFDPTEYYSTSSYTRGWNMGYLHGSHKLKIKYSKCRQQYCKLKEKYHAACVKLNALEINLPD